MPKTKTPILPTAIIDRAKKTVPIEIIAPENYDRWLKTQPDSARNWLLAQRQPARENNFVLLPDSNAALGKVAVFTDQPQLWTLAALPKLLPPGDYMLLSPPADKIFDLCLGFCLGAYQFTRYQTQPPATIAQLVLPKGVNAQDLLATAQAIYLARDLINTPAEDMGPENLHQVAKNLAKQHGAKFTAIVGQKLLAKNFPLIHAVGRAAEQEPRLLELNWGNPRHKKLTLIGKGVCFDTGGLDIKTADGMLLMKKDMGGAAHALALAHMIIARHLPVRLRVLIPAVENSISDEAFRPGDVFRARNGKSVEIGNTDAEGRLVLADALCLAAEGNPDIIVDFATLTGAARVALGPELPALFTNREALAQNALRHSQKTQDPLWPLPLWPNYRKMLRSKIADINNSGQSAMAGAITAALFLSEFVAKETDWLHLDVYAWNLADEPGRPQGGEAMTIRALFSLLQERFKHD